MCLTEYDEEAVLKMFEKEYFEKGFKRGFKRGVELGKYKFTFMAVNQGILSAEDAAAFLNVSPETYRMNLEKYNQDPEKFMFEVDVLSEEKI